MTTYTDYFGGFQYSYVENQGNQGGGGDSPIPDDPQDPEPPYGFEPVPVPPVETSRFSAQRGLGNNQEVPTRPTLQFFPTAEGYFDNINQKYVFQYKDHLGNVRLSYSRNPQTQVLEIIEENNYYPFGLKHQGYNMAVTSTNPASKRLYNGKELQDELGLNMYDYGARNYDPALGRFMTIDPLAEKSCRFNPYTYAFNNPIYFLDPDGMESQGYMLDDKQIAEMREDNKKFSQWVNNGGKNSEEIDPPKKKSKVDPQSKEEQAKYQKDIQNLNSNFAGIIKGMITFFTWTAGGGAGEVTEASILAKESIAVEASAYSKIGSTGKVGEDALKLLGGESQVYLKTSEGGRYVDQLVSGVINESKVGYTTLTKGISTQIAKDAEIVKNGTGGVQSAVWHFFKSPVTGKVGGSQPLLDELASKGIKTVNH